MDIKSKGGHWFRFADRDHALAVLATLDGWDAEQHQSGVLYPVGDAHVYEQGEVYTPTGETETVDGIEVPTTALKRGWFVCLLTPDILPPEGWEPWLYRWPDDQPPAMPGGWAEQMAACAEQAEDIDERLAIPATVPPRLTAEQREALAELRAQRIAAAESVAEARRVLDKIRERISTATAEIDGLPERRQRANATIQTLNETIATLRTDKDAQVAIAADTEQDRDTRQAARDEIERLNGEIDTTIAERDRLVVFRDAVAGYLDSLRADRTIAVEERTAAIAVLDAARADRDATKPALLAARGAVIRGA